MNDGDHAERTAWIALASIPGVGELTFERTLQAFGSAQAALDTVAGWRGGGADGRLARVLGIRVRTGVAARIRSMASDPAAPQRAMADIGGWTSTPLDGDYPPPLHDLAHPPAVLFGLGRKEALLCQPAVAVVGTRRPTAVGRGLAGRIARRLVEAGVTVVSGLAVGVDGAAHQATLEAGGVTLAVIGGGPDEPGPLMHRRLARTILERGAIVSEHAPGIRPTQGTFPRRNRIISALARATIVVEAPVRSGALITAAHALEQGRDLLVAPGRPLDAAVAGNLALLRETPARPLVGLDEMLVDLGLQDVGRSPSSTMGLSAAAAISLLGPAERAVATLLSTGPRDIDGLVRATRLSPGAVAAALTILQLRGWARPHGALHLAAGPLLQAASGERAAPEGRR